MSMELDRTSQADYAQSNVERKLHWHLLPVFFILVTVSFIDRTNLAFASIDMNKDLGLSKTMYGLGSGLFFIGYAACQIPSNMALMRLGAPLWLGLITCLWGICAACFVLVRGLTSFLALRLLLGICESGALPGTWYYLSLFYPASRITMPYAVVETASTVSQIIAAPLAALLLMLDEHLGLQGWQWIFLVEGLPAVALGVFLWFWLPRNVASAWFLSHAEREILETEMTKYAGLEHTSPQNRYSNLDKDNTSMQHLATQRTASVSQSSKGGVRSLLRRLWEVLQVKVVWYGGLWRWLHDIPGYGVLYWTPLVVEFLMKHPQPLRDEPRHMLVSPTLQTHGGSTRMVEQFQPRGANLTASAPTTVVTPKTSQVVLLTTIPFALASLFHLANAHHAQKTRENKWHIVVAWSLGALAFLCLPISLKAGGPIPAFLLLAIAHMGTNGANGCQTGFVVSHIRAEDRGLGLAMYNSLGNLGGFVGPFIVGALVDLTGSYISGLVVMGVALAGAAVMVAAFRVSGMSDGYMQLRQGESSPLGQGSAPDEVGDEDVEEVICTQDHQPS